MSNPPSADSDDRRRNNRAPIELRVEYKRLNSFFADYTRNISRGGTFIRTSKPLDVGTEFMFKLVVPKLKKPLEILGRVQWIIKSEDEAAGREPGMGIGFIYANDEERVQVEGIVEKLMIESLGPVLYDKIMGHRLPPENT